MLSPNHMMCGVWGHGSHQTIQIYRDFRFLLAAILGAMPRAHGGGTGPTLGGRFAQAASGISHGCRRPVTSSPCRRVTMGALQMGPRIDPGSCPKVVDLRPLPGQSWVYGASLGVPKALSGAAPKGARGLGNIFDVGGRTGIFPPGSPPPFLLGFREGRGRVDPPKSTTVVLLLSGSLRRSTRQGLGTPQEAPGAKGLHGRRSTTSGPDPGSIRGRRALLTGRRHVSAAR